MKRLIALSIMMVVLVALTSGICVAVSETLNIFMIANPDVGVGADSKNLDLNTYQNWARACLTETQMCGLSGDSRLDGINGGKVRTFEYSLDGSNGNEVAALVNSSAVPNRVKIRHQVSIPVTYYTLCEKVAYDANLPTVPPTALPAAGGYRTIKAAAVPQRSSAVALATGVAGIIGLLRRRKS